MEKTVKNDKTPTTKPRTTATSSNIQNIVRALDVFILYGLLCICTAVFIIGCNDSSRRPTDFPAAVFVGELVPEATQIIRRGLDDVDPLIRVNSIEVVATTKRIKLMPKVQRLLKDQVVPVRFASALAVGDLQYRLAERDVSKLLNDQNENVRIAAAYAIGRLGSANTFQILRKAMTSADQTVRANAAMLLGKSGDKSAIKLLWWTLGHDPGDKVRFQAAESIAMLGDERIYDTKLWAMLISAYVDDRVIGVRAMGALGTVQAKSALITMLDDGILEVRLAAAEQLGMLGEPIGEPVVIDVFRKNLTARMRGQALERANVRTALAIGRIGTPTLARFLPQLLKNQSKSVRIAAAKAVFQCVSKGRSVEKLGV